MLRNISTLNSYVDRCIEYLKFSSYPYKHKKRDIYYPQALNDIKELVAMLNQLTNMKAEIKHTTLLTEEKIEEYQASLHTISTNAETIRNTLPEFAHRTLIAEIESESASFLHKERSSHKINNLNFPPETERLYFRTLAIDDAGNRHEVNNIKYDLKATGKAWHRHFIFKDIGSSASGASSYTHELNVKTLQALTKWNDFYFANPKQTDGHALNTKFVVQIYAEKTIPNPTVQAPQIAVNDAAAPEVGHPVIAALRANHI